MLLAAHEWGCPPWEITGDDSRVTWFMRWLAYAEQRTMRQKFETERWQTP